MISTDRKCPSSDCFDAHYLQSLREGVPAVREHFADYFGQLLRIKLRRRLRCPQLIEDVRQETILRVLHTICVKGGINHPERLGAFVNSVCNNVIHEYLRAETRHKHGLEDAPEPFDQSASAEVPLIDEQRKREVREALAQLPKQDFDLLRMIFFEEKDREEVCRRLGVNQNYLRTLVHRAKGRFKERLIRQNRRFAPFPRVSDLLGAR